MAKIPAFARASSLEVLENALYNETGALFNLERICYVFLDDGEKFVYVDPNKQIHLINGNNKVVVQRVNELPPTTEADSEVLYIYDNVVYLWDPVNNLYKPTFYEVAIQIDNLTTQLHNAEERIAKLETDFISAEEAISILQGNVTSIVSDISDIKSNITTLQNTKADATEVNALGILVESKADADDIIALQNSKADKADTYTKTEVDNMVNVEIPGGGSMTIAEYVDTQSNNAVETANDYTDQQMQIHFV